jgi:hypothetical protein
VSGGVLVGDVHVSLSGDAEGASAVTFVGERLGQTQFEGRVDVMARRLRFWHARALPYVTASAGLLWQWHEGRVLIETGQVYQIGGGIRVSVLHHPASRLSHVGIASELRVAHVRKGFHWGREGRTLPVLHVGVFTGWGH